MIDVWQVFNYYARNNNELSGKDLYTALRCCGVNPTLKEINVSWHPPFWPIRTKPDLWCAAFALCVTVRGCTQ